MKIQILISKSSWAKIYIKKILKKLKNFSKNITVIDNHKKIKDNYDVNIIFSYFKKIPKKYLLRSKFNIVPHESDLPSGKGMSPLSWQILEDKKKIVFSLFDASVKIDSGKVYFKKIVYIPKDKLFSELKNIQFNINTGLIQKFLRHLNIYKKPPKSIISKKKVSYYRKRKPKDSEIDIYKNIKNQFNLLRIVDNDNYPAFFKIYGKKFYLKIFK